MDKRLSREKNWTGEALPKIIHKINRDAYLT
jgi:hypothetical protein